MKHCAYLQTSGFEAGLKPRYIDVSEHEIAELPRSFARLRDSGKVPAGMSLSDKTSQGRVDVRYHRSGNPFTPGWFFYFGLEGRAALSRYRLLRGRRLIRDLEAHGWTVREDDDVYI